MSLGYAEKLSYREDLGGQLGAPEHFDEGGELEAKVQQLVALVGGWVGWGGAHLGVAPRVNAKRGLRPVGQDEVVRCAL